MNLLVTAYSVFIDGVLLLGSLGSSRSGWVPQCLGRNMGVSLAGK